MRWFKHDSDCFMSEGVDALIEAEGFAGYGRWMRLLEIVAFKMDKTDRCHAEYSVQKWCSLLGLKQKKLSSFLKLTENQLKTKVVCFENIIRIEIPNLLKKRDNYTSDLEETSKRLPSIDTDIDIDTEEEKEKTQILRAPESSFPEKKEKPKTSTGSQTQESVFAELKSFYPKKNGKFLEEQEVFRRFCLVPEDDWPLLIQAVKNYANSERVKDGVGIKDPKNFIGNQMNESSYWKEWIEPEKTEDETDGEERTDELRRILENVKGA